jgi:hypothetical protein
MMKIAARRGLMMVPVFIAALVVAVWVFSYRSFEFKGGVGVRDSGVFSYPRYHAQLDDLPLWKSGEYQFIVVGYRLTLLIWCCKCRMLPMLTGRN